MTILSKYPSIKSNCIYPKVGLDCCGFGDPLRVSVCSAAAFCIAAGCERGDKVSSEKRVRGQSKARCCKGVGGGVVWVRTFGRRGGTFWGSCRYGKEELVAGVRRPRATGNVTKNGEGGGCGPLSYQVEGLVGASGFGASWRGGWQVQENTPSSLTSPERGSQD